MRATLLMLTLALVAAGCGEGEPEERIPLGGVRAKADDTAPSGLAALAGRWEQIDEQGNAVGATVAITVDGQRVTARAVSGGKAWTILSGVVGAAPEVEKYTVSSAGLLDSVTSTERRKIVTSLEQSGTGVERRVEMYSWLVSLKLWEDWTLYGTIADRLTIDGDRLRYQHEESQYDERSASYLFQRAR